MTGRQQRMFAAGALCCCGSHDVLLDGHTAIGRVQFRCGSCNAQWTAGNLGKPYIDFARAPVTSIRQ